jgi:pimeloyl-ACP methyl ester carboxylesterase
VRTYALCSALAVMTVVAVATACDQGDAIRRQAIADSKAISFTTSDGVQLAGRLFGPADATAGVVLAHMLPADQSSWFEFADRLGRMGYRALTFDARGYCPGGVAGCSQGTKAVSENGVDVAAAVSYLKGQGIERIGLVGASMGGTASLVVASSPDKAIDAVVTLSAPDAIDGLVAGPDVLQAVTAAKLFIAGNGDDVAARSAQAFYGESAAPKRLELLTTSDHGTDLLSGNQAEIARNLVIGWLNQYVPVT